MRLPSRSMQHVRLAYSGLKQPAIRPCSWSQPENATYDYECGSCRAYCEERHHGNEEAILHCYRTLCSRPCSYDRQYDR